MRSRVGCWLDAKSFVPYPVQPKGRAASFDPVPGTAIRIALRRGVSVGTASARARSELSQVTHSTGCGPPTGFAVAEQPLAGVTHLLQAKHPRRPFLNSKLGEWPVQTARCFGKKKKVAPRR